MERNRRRDRIAKGETDRRVREIQIFQMHEASQSKSSCTSMNAAVAQ